MGQKVSPTGFRMGITEDWRSRWYADKDYAKNLENDMAIRKFLDKRLARAAGQRQFCADEQHSGCRQLLCPAHSATPLGKCYARRRAKMPPHAPPPCPETKFVVYYSGVMRKDIHNKSKPDERKNVKWSMFSGPAGCVRMKCGWR